MFCSSIFAAELLLVKNRLKGERQLELLSDCSLNLEYKFAFFFKLIKNVFKFFITIVFNIGFYDELEV